MEKKEEKKKEQKPEKELEKLTEETLKKYEKLNRPNYFEMMMDGTFMKMVSTNKKDKKEEGK